MRGYRRLRERIFCEEQRLFPGSDRDPVDEHAIPIVAVSRVAGMPDEVVGVVRIWQEGATGEAVTGPSIRPNTCPDVWWGGRLGTHPDHRRNGTIGPGLVHLAVTTACRRGCVAFRATIQMRNVSLFERLKWTVVGDVEVCGQPHALMEADLDHYRRALA
jgi:putative N-acetyltransferase (TIGR04045 family)